jgi:hypothetical protein
MPKLAKLTKWKPKVWRAEYERAVAYSALGMANTAIAQKLGFTPEFVSNILNLDESKQRMKEFVDRLKSQNNVDVVEMAAKVTGKSLERLSSMLENDETFNKSPFALIDRGLRVSEMMMKKGVTENPGTSVHIHNGEGASTMVITPGEENNLMNALRKSQEVKKLNAAQEINAA